jgi:hypothetical protein
MPTKRQVLGRFGEMCVASQCSCPRCKRARTLRRLPNNFKCADLICDFRGYLAQVKAVTVRDIEVVPDDVLGAAWGPQQERMAAAIYFPLFWFWCRGANTQSSIYRRTCKYAKCSNLDHPFRGKLGERDGKGSSIVWIW